MIKLYVNKESDINYLGRIIEIQDYESIPGADRIKVARVFGFKVVVGNDAEPGKYVYFPVGSVLNPEMLSFLGLYRKSKYNTDKTKEGDLEFSGRIKGRKFRGIWSEGYLLRIEEVEQWLGTFDSGTILWANEFDTLGWQDSGGNHSTWILKKFCPKIEPTRGKQRPDMRGNVPERLYRRMIPGQFNFHYETLQLKYKPGIIRPDTFLWITKKVDGTSGISAKVLVQRKSWEVWKPRRYYAGIYASSSVIKSKWLNHKAGPGWYGVDIWAEADKVVGPKLWKGMTAYYEIVGYLPNGEFIQKNNDFGCIKPGGDEFEVGKNFRVLLYRITLTSPDGEVHEFTPPQVKEWAESVGLESVTLLYEGWAKNLYPELDPAKHWNDNFMDRLSKDFGMEGLDPECKNEVPLEGLVIRVGNLAYKLKSNFHLERKAAWEESGYQDPEDLA
ncbi:MAG: hypothetical protein J6I84_02470 [Bacilli bacterium]|nr:hypothetical protein [Bacilli bacterium]